MDIYLRTEEEDTGSLSLPAQPKRERVTLGVHSCIQKETELTAGTECSHCETLGESLPSWGFIWIPRQEPPEIFPVNSLHFTQTFSREDYGWDVLCTVAWNYNGRGVYFHDSLASGLLGNYCMPGLVLRILYTQFRSFILASISKRIVVFPIFQMKLKKLYLDMTIQSARRSEILSLIGSPVLSAFSWTPQPQVSSCNWPSLAL